MKRDLLVFFTGAVIAIALGAWLRLRMSVSFTGFTDTYICGSFGLPDKNYNVLRFTPKEERRVTVESLWDSRTYEVGRLNLESSSLGRLELASELVHSSTLPLNPLAEHFIEGKGRSVFVVGRLEGRELYRFECHR